MLFSIMLPARGERGKQKGVSLSGESQGSVSEGRARSWGLNLVLPQMHDPAEPPRFCFWPEVEPLRPRPALSGPRPHHQPGVVLWLPSPVVPR